LEKITVPARIDNLAQMIEFVTKAADAAGLEKGLVGKIQLASEEALVNVINYAYAGGEGDLELQYEIENDPKTLIIQVADSGVPFNPLDKEDPDINLPAEDRPIGGLGIFMIRQIMDSVDYKRDNNRNLLIMKKTI
jgi:anti-sigma regulatory factor (Ser/Thr protein kinase)